MSNYLKYGKILNTYPYKYGIKDCSLGKIIFESLDLQEIVIKTKILITHNPSYYNYKIISGNIVKHFDQ